MEEMLRLGGEELDLKQLAREFRKGTAWVVKGDQYYFLILESERSRDNAALLAAGTEALACMNALMMARAPYFRPPIIQGVTRKNADGSLIHCVSLAGSALLRADNSGTLTVLGTEGNVIENKAPTEGEVALELAINNEHLRRAQVIYGSLEHDWVNLYKVLDVMREAHGDLSGLIAKNFVSAKDINNFKATAESFPAVGLKARHGKTKGVIKKPRMTLAEAQEMFRKLFQAWIKEIKEMKAEGKS